MAGPFARGIPLSKRLFDVIVTTLGLIILSPLLLIVALIVWIRHGPPILFRQQRPGFLGRPFFIYKFRTMTGASDEAGQPLPDSQRLTGLGRWLRASSLDELPGLFNVWRGDMSLVGPRPLLMQYLERYSPEQMRRHDVLPGLTGLAQINGRNAQTWDQRFSLDLWYVDHWSFGLDLRILLITLWKVVTREGISPPGRATMDEFMGPGRSNPS